MNYLGLFLCLFGGKRAKISRNANFFVNFAPAVCLYIWYQKGKLLLDSRCDEKLVEASQAGDKNAYASLVKAYYRYVFLVCLGMVGNVHDAEDIAQDVMLKGFEQIRKLRDPGQFGSWIARISKNLCINFIRRKQRTGKALTEKAIRLNQTADENGRLHQAIEKLPQDVRLPLVMYYFDGESVRTVSQKLNISDSSVYQKLRTGIKQLHRLLAEQGEIK